MTLERQRPVKSKDDLGKDMLFLYSSMQDVKYVFQSRKLDALSACADTEIGTRAFINRMYQGSECVDVLLDRGCTRFELD
jgi:hypothetical protein